MKPFLAFSLLLIIGCNQQKRNAAPPLMNTIDPISTDYDSCKAVIATTKNKYRKRWASFIKIEKEKIFTTAVVTAIIPNWIGTKWDFNGTSQVPRKGSIACGYFVTTVLRDAGMNIARIKLAQCTSEKMITTLIQPKYITRFSNLPMQDFIGSIKAHGYGLYIVGLDNHTGFIYNDGTTIYFIHSSYIGTRAVEYGIASTNAILQASKYKVLGKLSADENVLEKWMK